MIPILLESDVTENLEASCKEREISWQGSNQKLGWVEKSPSASFVYTFDKLELGQKYEFVAVVFSRGVNTGVAVSSTSVYTPESTLLFL